ncbi:MAG TPA: patatin-like protein [Burkholderiales bacterium]|nr:patatin-like protein [Burkholderiales bacterium]
MAPLDVVQEVRFAVVMYGGVSLAIYINGVAQELLNLVRATGYADGDPSRSAGALPAADLKSTERIYRKLAYLAGSRALREDYRQWLADAGNPARKAAPEVDRCVDTDATIGTRFVIDILSGTSAGGINAIFLAKAMAKDKSIAGLKNLWVKEGDLGSLINDKKSLAGMTNVELVDPPRSLLNSRRMYYKLLGAFRDVDKSRADLPAAAVSPYVDELDLYVTTTDLYGVALPIRLADRVVYEKRHRNVFHFRYGAGGLTPEADDFTAGHNPFLAFAARCTSSFPFAFEPMCLEDVDAVCKTSAGFGPGPVAPDPKWRRYFTESFGSAANYDDLDFLHRPFGDGGYLDNKPFTYVTETLARRYSNYPVDRKLLYIEPSPEHPEEGADLLSRPNALRNVYGALMDLPRQETIREDLQRLLDRNRLIERADRTLNQVRNDIFKADREAPGVERTDWRDKYLPDTIDTYGIAYIPYRRMRIADATDTLARCFTRAARFDTTSDEFLAVRAIMHVWRVAHYSDYREEGRPSVNAFLDDFDLGFRVRRMTFVRRQIDLLHRVSDSTREALEDPDASGELQNAYRHLKRYGYDYDTTHKRIFKQALTALKQTLNTVEHQLQRARVAIEEGAQQSGGAGGALPALPAAVQTLGIARLHLKFILGLQWDPAWSARLPDVAHMAAIVASAAYSQAVTNEEREARVRELLADPAAYGLPASFALDLESTAEGLKAYLYDVFDQAFNGVKSVLDPATAAPDRDPVEAAVGSYLWNEFLNFEDYDQVTFPILYGTDVGEAEPVRIYRISPEDATRIVNEREQRRHKLAGTSLFNFGGFLDEAWRENDIMWGRLDGVERLVTAVLPDLADEPLRAHLIEEAHVAILDEVAQSARRRDIGGAIAKSLFRTPSPDADILRAEEHARRQRERDVERVVNGMLTGRQLLRVMREDYAVDRRLDPKPVLEWVSRSTQVVGKMFEDIARQARSGEQSKHLAWVARFGGVFWGLVQLAVPGSLKNLLFYHWFKVLVAFEALILAGGLVLNHDAAAHFGWLSLSLTLLVGLTVTVLGDLMRLKRGWLYASLGLVVLAVLGFAVLGIDRVFDLEWFRLWS